MDKIYCCDSSTAVLLRVSQAVNAGFWEELHNEHSYQYEILAQCIARTAVICKGIMNHQY